MLRLPKLKEEDIVDEMLAILSEMGPVPENVISTIQNADADTLSKWIKLVVKCDSVDDFVKRAM